MRGLSEIEAIARRKRGQGNNVRFQASRTYLQIVRRYAFTFINTVLFGISIVLILMGQHGDALVTAGLVLLNVIFGVVQEGRAKRKLEQIALLTRPQATVVRDGREKSVDPGQIVLGDVLVARPGDQIVVDGQVIGDGRIEVDESLLTGESERVAKQAGASVYSGSFCITGSACYEVGKVGADSFANQLAAEARVFRQVKTPLQTDIDFIIRILVLLAADLGLLLAIAFMLQDVPLVEGVRVAAVIVALVPQGLFFMTTVAYAMGALRMAGQGALIQQANAVESISHVNLLCLDKTGTLTTNRLHLRGVHLLGDVSGDHEDQLRHILGDYAASTADGNRTTAAIAEACAGQPRLIAEAVPFSSEYRWSALTFDDPALRGTYVLGAPEALRSSLPFDPKVEHLANEWATQGQRLLLFTRCPDNSSLYDAQHKPRLPASLIPLGLLRFDDELRPEAEETLRHFAELGIELKVISGDNPHTVAALAKKVGFSDDGQVVSGLDLDTIDDAQLEQATIFGRITPHQKEELVRTFREKGRYVAMIGDGVNDVLSLKGAHVGIAMQSGSQATRGVSDIVLLGDSFAALPIAFEEGQRIVKGMGDVIRLLVTRTFYVLFLVIATQIAGMPFPVTPKHNSVLALLTVGIPILAIAAWARPSSPSRSIVRSTSRFVFPAAFTVSVVALVTYLVYLGTTSDVAVARSALTAASVLCGLVLIPYVEPPTKWWVAGDALSGDWRPTLMAIALLAFYGIIVTLPPLRTFFELTPLHMLDYVLIGGGVAVWALFLRFAWRARLFERLLGYQGLSTKLNV